MTNILRPHRYLRNLANAPAVGTAQSSFGSTLFVMNRDSTEAAENPRSPYHVLEGLDTYGVNVLPIPVPNDFLYLDIRHAWANSVALDGDEPLYRLFGRVPKSTTPPGIGNPHRHFPEDIYPDDFRGTNTPRAYDLSLPIDGGGTDPEPVGLWLPMEDVAGNYLTVADADNVDSLCQRLRGAAGEASSSSGDTASSSAEVDAWCIGGVISTFFLAGAVELMLLVDTPGTSGYTTVAVGQLIA